MRKLFFKRRFVFAPFLIAAFITLISFVVMLLWNGLLPDIFHLPLINFWQAMGLFVLSKILFGFGKGGGRFGAPWMRGRMEERFMNMSDEERQAFKARMRGARSRCWNDVNPEPAATQPNT